MIGRITQAAVIVAATFHGPLHAASDDLQTGWAAWFNSAKLSDRWSLVSDVQLRSSDGGENLRNFIGRGGLSYALDNRHSVAAGYAYIDTYAPGALDLTEHRIWQQLVAQRRVGNYPLTHRLRLEQRFIKRATGDDIYSDRLRYFARLMLPLEGNGSAPFKQGYYAALQNEVFLHLSNRNELNGKLFDQNRAYAGLGWRLNPGLDVELGYLNQLLNGRATDTQNHAIQLSLHSRL